MRYTSSASSAPSLTRAILRAENVTHRYGKTMTLQRLDLEVVEDEFLVILGPSGCGKSTLLNLFAGFERPEVGQLLLHDKPIVDVEPRCGMVFQDYALFPWLSVAKNIAFGPRLRGQVDHERIQRLLTMVGIEGFGEESEYPTWNYNRLAQTARLLYWRPEPGEELHSCTARAWCDTAL